MSLLTENLTIRRARADEADHLSALALRSKAVWGYDADFIAACVAELTVTPDDIRTHENWVADRQGVAVGMYELIVAPDRPKQGELHMFFVEPHLKGTGLGRRLWAHMEACARQSGLTTIQLDADPNACGFYTHMGCREIGSSPSGSIPGRRLPRLEKRLAGS